AQRAGGEDVAVDGVDLVGLHGVDPEVAHRPAQVVHVHVGDHHVRAFFDQVLHQVVADLADALYGDPPALQPVLAPGLLGAGPHAEQHPPRGHGRGIAGAAELGGYARDVAGLAVDDVHVLARGPDVLRGDVAAPQGLDEPSVRPEQLLALDALGVPDDDGLAPAQVQPGRGGLVGHAPGQAEDVAQRVVLGLERVEPGSA